MTPFERHRIDHFSPTSLIWQGETPAKSLATHVPPPAPAPQPATDSMLESEF